MDLAWLGRPLRFGALVRLEFRFVSPRDDLVLQSVCLAIAVRIRGMVWCRRRRPAPVPDPVSCGACPGRCVDSLCPPDRHDLALRAPGIIGAEMDDQGDLSDR